MKTVKPHFRAHIKLRTAEAGGRRSPVSLSRYRPDFSFAVDQKQYYGAHFVSEGEMERLADEQLAPGAESELDVWVRSAAMQIMPQLNIGSTFRVLEGSRAVGDGVVTQIYRVDE